MSGKARKKRTTHDKDYDEICVLPHEISTINRKIIYLDNNATTQIHPVVMSIMNRWLKCIANPSAPNEASKFAGKALECAKRIIAKHCGISTDTHKIIFTSGGSESNSFIIRSACSAFETKCHCKPHVIVSAIEHKSILACVDSLVSGGKIEASYILPNIYGCIQPSLVEKAIRPNTCIVSVMHANNEIGSVSDIRKIAEICHAHNIPFHTDTVQSFGKYKIDFPSYGIDAISVSFHKLYGPLGVGLLIISNSFVDGYGLQSIVSGSQQYGLRGGTEFVPGIMGAIASLQIVHTDRKKKNERLLRLRNFAIAGIAKKLPIGDYANYAVSTSASSSSSASASASGHRKFEVIILGPPLEMTDKYIPNTLLIAFAKNTGKEFCNADLREDLEKQGIVVGIGSACLTTSLKASHVLEAISAPPVIQRSVIRISMSDDTTKEDINHFVNAYIKAIKKQIKDIIT